ALDCRGKRAKWQFQQKLARFQRQAYLVIVVVSLCQPQPRKGFRSFNPPSITG
ncbi:hypothetical protein HHI36_013059, partial [Cryptolaemus montrouzieri]